MRQHMSTFVHPLHQIAPTIPQASPPGTRSRIVNTGTHLMQSTASLGQQSSTAVLSDPSELIDSRGINTRPIYLLARIDLVAALLFLLFPPLSSFGQRRTVDVLRRDLPLVKGAGQAHKSIGKRGEKEVPPPPLYKLRPCPSYSRRRDRNNCVHFNCVQDVVWPHKTWVCCHVCQLHGAMDTFVSLCPLQPTWL